MKRIVVAVGAVIEDEGKILLRPFSTSFTSTIWPEK